MKTDAELIEAALDQRFSSVPVPPCPDVAWRAATTKAAGTAGSRPAGGFRRVAIAASLLVAVGLAGLTAQASGTIRAGYDRLFSPFLASSKPLQPIIHRADQLTVAQAQRRIPFTIVELTGLPEHTRFLYAHVVREGPIPRVALNYEAHVANKYYRINVNETTVAVGPPVTHVTIQRLGHGTKTWTVPLRRWKNGAVVMELLPSGLPDAVTDRIVSANTK